MLIDRYPFGVQVDICYYGILSLADKYTGQRATYVCR